MAKQAAKLNVKGFKIHIPLARVSFPNVFTPRAFEDGPEKYECQFLWPKDTDLSVLKKAIHSAIVEAWGKDKAKWPEGLKSPIKDGDKMEDLEGYEGQYYIKTSSHRKPGVINRKKEVITNEDDFYGGCYAIATVLVKAYATKGNKGVTIYLNNIQKVKDGEPFGGRSNPEADFDEIEDGSDDASNYDDSALGIDVGGDEDDDMKALLG